MVTIALALDKLDVAALRFALGARNYIGADPHVVDRLADLTARLPSDLDFAEPPPGIKSDVAIEMEASHEPVQP
jgi:hypothetical protein